MAGQVAQANTVWATTNPGEFRGFADASLTRDRAPKLLGPVRRNTLSRSRRSPGSYWLLVSWLPLVKLGHSIAPHSTPQHPVRGNHLKHAAEITDKCFDEPSPGYSTKKHACLTRALGLASAPRRSRCRAYRIRPCRAALSDVSAWHDICRGCVQQKAKRLLRRPRGRSVRCNARHYRPPMGADRSQIRARACFGR